MVKGCGGEEATWTPSDLGTMLLRQKQIAAVKVTEMFTNKQKSWPKEGNNS